MSTTNEGISSGIFCCACGSVPTRVQKNFLARYPECSLPPLYLSRKIKPFLQGFSREMEIYRLLSMLSTKRGRFGYYISWDSDGSIIDYVDVLSYKKPEKSIGRK